MPSIASDYSEPGWTVSELRLANGDLACGFGSLQITTVEQIATYDDVLSGVRRHEAPR